MARKYIKGKDGKFNGSVPDGKNVPTTVKLPKSIPAEASDSKAGGPEWVVSYVLEDGSKVRGIQNARHGNAAIDFYAKDNNLNFTSATSEKKATFDRFLAEGKRTPLEPSGNAIITWEEWEKIYNPIQNPGRSDQGLWGCMFETQGDDVRYLHDKEYHENVYWTLVDNNPNSGYLDLMPGVHAVNRLGFFITQNRWTNKRLVVTNDPE